VGDTGEPPVLPPRRGTGYGARNNNNNNSIYYYDEDEEGKDDEGKEGDEAEENKFAEPELNNSVPVVNEPEAEAEENKFAEPELNNSVPVVNEPKAEENKFAEPELNNSVPVVNEPEAEENKFAEPELNNSVPVVNEPKAEENKFAEPELNNFVNVPNNSSHYTRRDIDSLTEALTNLGKEGLGGKENSKLDKSGSILALVESVTKQTGEGGLNKAKKVLETIEKSKTGAVIKAKYGEFEPLTIDNYKGVVNTFLTRLREQAAAKKQGGSITRKRKTKSQRMSRKRK
jgi:hypothetical protein